MALTIFTGNYQNYSNQSLPQIGVQSQYTLPWTLNQNLSDPFTGPVGYSINTTGVKGVTVIPGVEDVTQAMYSPIYAEIYDAPVYDGVYTQITFTPSGSIQGSAVTLVEEVGAFAYYGTEITAYNALTNYFLNNDYPRNENVAAFNAITTALDQQLTGTHSATVVQELTSAAQSSLASGDSQFYQLAEALIPIAQEWDTPEYFLNTGSGLRSVSALDFEFGVNLTTVNGAESTWSVNGSSGGVSISGFSAYGYAVDNNNGGVTPYYIISNVLMNGQLEPSAITTIKPSDNFLPSSGGGSDILFRNDTTGDTGFYAINNGANTGWNDVGASSTAYGVVGAGDFYGNGTSDILYRNNSNGDTGFYQISNGANVGWQDIGMSSTAYIVVGVGDFTGSGTDDILYRNNSNGDTGFYQIVNGANTGWVDVGASSTAYSVVGVGDFMGTGTDDILYRNNTTGDTGFYNISNGVNMGWVDIGASSTAYSVVAVGDYLGNGMSDILFRNNANGDTGFYAVSNGVNTGWHDIGNSSTAYHVVG
jgi:hypothetical protein